MKNKLKKIFSKRICLVLLILVAVSLVSYVCLGDHYSDSLIVVSGAKSTRFIKENGGETMSYQVKADFPADAVISKISARLKEKGWEPLNEDFMNPGTPSSLVRGWVEFGVHTKQPHEKVHMWATDWTNKNRDVVMYYLRYRYVEGEVPDMKTLQVSAFYAQAALARQMKDAPMPPTTQLAH